MDKDKYASQHVSNSLIYMQLMLKISETETR